MRMRRRRVMKIGDGDEDIVGVVDGEGRRKILMLSCELFWCVILLDKYVQYSTVVSLPKK
jgi:hypothetical protein